MESSIRCPSLRAIADAAATTKLRQAQRDERRTQQNFGTKTRAPRGSGGHRDRLSWIWRRRSDASARAMQRARQTNDAADGKDSPRSIDRGDDPFAAKNGGIHLSEQSEDQQREAPHRRQQSRRDRLHG